MAKDITYDQAILTRQGNTGNWTVTASILGIEGSAQLAVFYN
jgi:hypothetical protein